MPQPLTTSLSRPALALATALAFGATPAPSAAPAGPSSAASAPLSSAAASACPAPNPAADWMARVPLRDSSAPVRPADCATVRQTPPDFSWPHRGAGARYEFRLVGPDGRVRRRETTDNWMAWGEALPPGDYRWGVRVSMPGQAPLDARLRRFTVSAQAVPFVVPPWTALFERASTTPHPRAVLPQRDAFVRALQSQRRGALSGLTGEVEAAMEEPLPPEPAPRGAAEYWGEVHRASARARNAAFAWLTTGRERHADEALRRVMALAAWPPRGNTSFANADEAARDITWTLALAYDWLHPRLDPDQRRRLLDTLAVRVGDLHADVIRGNPARVAIHPFDSHGNQSVLYLAAVSVLLAGDLPQARDWLRDAVPVALQWTSPWGGEDGGYANGTAYAQWDATTSLPAWRILRWATGVDLGRKAWVREHARFLAYFLPPGGPAGVFGDGAEQDLSEPRARAARSLSRFAPSPLADWYAAQLSGEDTHRIDLLLTELEPEPGRARTQARAREDGGLPPGTPDAALFPSIGWVAMHSRLADPQRVSVYFRSSPYGSFNHGHADQNGFVINAGGERLAIDSGYYDGYKTPHWWQWYKQTRAANAVTFDGGQGQSVFETDGRLLGGSVTHFEHHASHDIAVGDATAAYDGALTRARRTLVYLRPGLVLVNDVLASPRPRRWEWNLHALRPMREQGAGVVQIRSGEASLCARMADAQAFDFVQTDRFTAAPQAGPDRPDQWHGAFVSRDRSREADLLAVLQVGCGDPSEVTARRTDCGWTVDAGRHAVTFCDGRVEVADRAASRRKQGAR